MMRNISRAVYIVSVVLLLLEHARANWPVVRYTNGTVGVTSDYGVHIETERTQVSGQFSVSGDLFVRDSNIVDRISKLEMQIPPICMPPGAEGLLFDGTSWICECAEYYFGTSCDIACQSNTTHYYNTTTSTCEENTASFITINGNTLYRDSEGWIILLAYNHKAGENNAFVSGTAPVSPTESYSHIWLEDLGLTEDDVDSVKFFCNTSAHARVIHFSVNNDMIKTAVITGTPTSNAASYWNTGTTKFSDHTGYLPDATTDASGADLTEAVFYKSNTYHWGMKIQGSRWECDDFSRNTANTLHQIWFKQKSTTSSPPSTLSPTEAEFGELILSDPSTYYLQGCAVSYASSGYLRVTSSSCDLGRVDLSFTRLSNQIGSIEFEMKISHSGRTPDGVSFSIADASSNKPATEIYGDSSNIYKSSLYWSETGVWSRFPSVSIELDGWGNPPTGTGIGLVVYYKDVSGANKYAILKQVGSSGDYSTGNMIQYRIDLFTCQGTIDKTCLSMSMDGNMKFSNIDITAYLPEEVIFSFSGRSSYTQCDLQAFKVSGRSA